MARPYQRKSDGLWVAAISVAGKRIVRYAKTRREATAILAQLQRDHYLGTLAGPSRVLLAEWIDQWLQHCEISLRPSSVDGYRRTIRPLLPLIGHVRVDRLSASNINSALIRLHRQGTGPRMVQLAWVCLRIALERAVSMGLIGHNPVLKVPKPRFVPQERRYWDQDQTRRFLSTALASEHRQAPLLVFLLGSGVRLGEALGLQWADADLVAGTIHVHRSLVWVSGKAILGRPKTRSSERTISLPDFALDVLKRRPQPLNPEMPIFTSETGTPPMTPNVRRTLARLCELANVPFINVHGLRHIAASWALNEGVPLPLVSRALGHGSTAITASVYAHAVGNSRVVADALDQALGNR